MCTERKNFRVQRGFYTSEIVLSKCIKHKPISYTKLATNRACSVSNGEFPLGRKNDP